MSIEKDISTSCTPAECYVSKLMVTWVNIKKFVAITVKHQKLESVRKEKMTLDVHDPRLLDLVDEEKVKQSANCKLYNN